MPKKNPRCRICHDKMKHHKWLRRNNNLSRHGVEVWNRIVKCRSCGYEQEDWKARWGKMT